MLAEVICYYKSSKIATSGTARAKQFKKKNSKYQHKWDVISPHLLHYGFNWVCEGGDLCSQIYNPDLHCLSLERRLFPHCINPSSLFCSQELVKLLKLLFDRLLRLLSLELRRNSLTFGPKYTTTCCFLPPQPWCLWFTLMWLFILSHLSFSLVNDNRLLFKVISWTLSWFFRDTQ